MGGPPRPGARAKPGDRGVGFVGGVRLLRPLGDGCRRSWRPAFRCGWGPSLPHVRSLGAAWGALALLGGRRVPGWVGPPSRHVRSLGAFFGGPASPAAGVPGRAGGPLARPTRPSGPALRRLRGATARSRRFASVVSGFARCGLVVRWRVPPSRVSRPPRQSGARCWGGCAAGSGVPLVHLLGFPGAPLRTVLLTPQVTWTGATGKGRTLLAEGVARGTRQRTPGRPPARGVHPHPGTRHPPHHLPDSRRGPASRGCPRPTGDPRGTGDAPADPEPLRGTGQGSRGHPQRSAHQGTKCGREGPHAHLHHHDNQTTPSRERSGAGGSCNRTGVGLIRGQPLHT